MERTQFMERFYSANMNYAADEANLPACAGGAVEGYNMNFVGAGAAYTLTATPIGNQAGARSACNKAILTVNQSGARTPAECW